MKKLQVIFMAFILTTVVCTSTLSVMAAENESSPLGVLVSVERQDYSDGSYSIDRTYVSHNTNNLSKSMLRTKTYGTDTFTKVRDISSSGTTSTLLLTCQVTGTFDWDSSTKKVKISDVKGEITYSQGGKITNKKTTTSGNNTTKATGKYSFTRNFSSGLGDKSIDYSVSVSCDYKGKNS